MNAAERADFTEADVIRNIGYVTMEDGTRLAYISYHPKKSGLYPTVFLYDPYTANSATFECAKEFLDAGYAFVGANLPGTGCSEGVIDFWHENRMVKGGPYGAEVVEWIARQPWSDGNIGMVGNSSAGTPQFWVAAERPSHLRAIVPTGFGDGYEFWLHQGGILLPSQVATWSIESEFVTGAEGAEWRGAHGDTECAEIRESDRQVRKGTLFDEVRKHPLRDEWWDSQTLISKEVAGRVIVPTMMIGTWQEEYGGSAMANVRMFTHFLQDVKNKRLVLMNGRHQNNGPGPRGYSIIDEERLRFLDRWVKGVNNGAENVPPITVYWEVQQREGNPKTSVAGWVTHHNIWPDPKVERRTYYLTADAKISPESPGAVANEGSRAYLYPVGTELARRDSQQFQLRPKPVGVLNYRTAPAYSDMVLLGNPEIVLYLSIDNGDDADIQLTLKDVSPDGTVLYLQSGLLRASLRAIDKGRKYVDEVVHSFRKSEKLVPGEIYELRMSLISPIAHVVRQGHSLELTIGATNPISAIGSIPAGAASINRIYHSAKYPSKVLLPIIPGAVAQAPAPACSALSGQASRKDDEFFPGGLPIQ